MSGANSSIADEAGRSAGRARRLLQVQPGEGRAVLWSAGTFFILLASYYFVRPMREEIGAEHHESLEMLYTLTFIGMLIVLPVYGLAVTHLSRQRLVPLVLRVLGLILLGFFAAHHLLPRVVPGARSVVEWIFFPWVSVFGLLLVAMFWSLMADVFSSAQGKRLFGPIAVGGTLGSIVASFSVGMLLDPPAWLGGGDWFDLHRTALLLIAAGLLELAVRTYRRIEQNAAEGRGDEADAGANSAPALGGQRAGRWRELVRGFTAVVRSPYLIGIAGYILLMTFSSTFLYMQQEVLVGELLSDREARTELFARFDLLSNGGTLVVQLVAVGWIIRWFGVGVALAILPGLCLAGFAMLGVVQLEGMGMDGAAGSGVIFGIPAVLVVVAVFQAVQRMGRYAVARPAREVLYTVVPRGAKYEAKAFIDMAVYRGSDVASAWLFAGLRGLGWSLGTIALATLPVLGVWAGVGWLLGRWQGRRVERDG